MRARAPQPINSNSTVETEQVKAKSVAVVANEIKGGVPNLFFGTALQAKTLVYDAIFARNDIQLAYAGTNHGSGTEIVKQEMLLIPTIFANQTFYQHSLGWDFNATWKLQEGKDYPVFKTTQPSSEPALHEEPSNWSIKTVQRGIKVIASSPLTIYVVDLIGRIVYASVIQDEMLIPLHEGVYII